MIDEELQARIDAYALGALAADERRALETHMATRATPAERAAFARAVETAAMLATALPASRPPAGVWRRISASLSARRSSRLAWALAAVAALALVWAVVERGRRGRAEAALADSTAACRRELAALSGTSRFAGQAVALLELPGTQLIPLERAQTGGGELAANAIYHRGVHEAYVVIGGVPDHGDVAYEVWIVRGGHRELAGKAVPDPRGRVLLTVPRPALETGVPASFEVTDAAGTLLLSSKIPI